MQILPNSREVRKASSILEGRHERSPGYDRPGLRMLDRHCGWLVGKARGLVRGHIHTLAFIIS